MFRVPSTRFIQAVWAVASVSLDCLIAILLWYFTAPLCAVITVVPAPSTSGILLPLFAVLPLYCSSNCPCFRRWPLHPSARLVTCLMPFLSLFVHCWNYSRCFCFKQRGFEIYRECTVRRSTVCTSMCLLLVVVDAFLYPFFCIRPCTLFMNFPQHQVPQWRGLWLSAISTMPSTKGDR